MYFLQFEYHLKPLHVFYIPDSSSKSGHRDDLSDLMSKIRPVKSQSSKV